MKLLSTEEALVRITGTTFGVIKGADSTCVCVFEGTVSTENRSGSLSAAVEPGRRVSHYRNEKEPYSEPLYPLSRVEEDMVKLLDDPKVRGAQRQRAR